MVEDRLAAVVLAVAAVDRAGDFGRCAVDFWISRPLRSPSAALADWFRLTDGSFRMKSERYRYSTISVINNAKPVGKSESASGRKIG